MLKLSIPIGFTALEQTVFTQKSYRTLGHKKYPECLTFNCETQKGSLYFCLWKSLLEVGFVRKVECYYHCVQSNYRSDNATITAFTVEFRYALK